MQRQRNIDIYKYTQLINKRFNKTMAKCYVQLETFSLPDSAVRWALDVIPTDGKLLIVNGTEVWREEKPRSRTFERLAALSSDAPGVLRISPGNEKAAIVSSAGNSLLVFDPTNGDMIFNTAAGGGNFFFDAEWYDDSLLAVTEAISGEGPVVKLFNLDVGDSKIILRNIGAASGGVTFDQNGSLIAGNGFSSDADDETGLIKVYSLDIWQQAWDNSISIDFEDSTVGAVVANLLSGAYLGFDRYNNLHIGGGDISSSSPDSDYTAIVFRSTLEEILDGQAAPVTPSSPKLKEDPSGVWQSLDPDESQKNLAWVVHANKITGELMLTAFEDPDKYYNFLLENEDTQLSEKEVTFDANYQLGDNPGFYKGSAFVGFELKVPLQLPSLSSFNGDFVLLIETKYMETFDGQSRHAVTLGDEFIGNLEDDQNRTDQESFSFNISRSTLQKIIDSGNPSTLTIQAQELAGGLSDDFIVHQYGYRVSI